MRATCLYFLAFAVVAATGCDSSAGYAADGGAWGTVDAGGGGRTYFDGGVGAPLSDAGAAMASDAGAVEPPPVEGTDAGPVDVCANRETMEPVVLYLSADDSNSMASPAIARQAIRRGQIPNAHYLRTYEFLNYYNVRYAEPEPGNVTVVPELRATDDPDELVLQIGVQSASMAPRRRVITLVLDTSGSMGGRPIELLRASCRALAGELRAGDVVSMVEWNTTRTVPLENHVVSGPDDVRLLAAIGATSADGGTNLSGGLTHGYELAMRNYDPEALNRVVLISDGQANAGETDERLISLHSEDAEQEGIFLVGVGVGDGFNDTLMDVVTDAGRGAYVFIDSPQEAQSIFGDRFDEVMEVALMNVRVELTLPWYMAVREFHGEEISTIAKEVRPQHLAPGDAMVFHQSIATCDSEELDLEHTITARATFTRPDGRVQSDEAVEVSMQQLLDAEDIGLRRGDAIVAWAEALKDIAGGLRGAQARILLATVRALCAEANPDGTDPGMVEIDQLASELRLRF